MGGIVLFSKYQLGIGWAGAVEGLMEASWAGWAVGASDRGVGAFGTAWACLGGAPVVCGEVGVDSDSALRGGLASFLVMAKGLAAEALCVAAVGSGFLPPASSVKHGDRPFTYIDDISWEGDHNCPSSCFF